MCENCLERVDSICRVSGAMDAEWECRDCGKQKYKKEANIPTPHSTWSGFWDGLFWLALAVAIPAAIAAVCIWGK